MAYRIQLQYHSQCKNSNIIYQPHGCRPCNCAEVQTWCLLSIIIMREVNGTGQNWNAFWFSAFELDIWVLQKGIDFKPEKLTESQRYLNTNSRSCEYLGISNILNIEGKRWRTLRAEEVVKLSRNSYSRQSMVALYSMARASTVTDM